MKTQILLSGLLLAVQITAQPILAQFGRQSKAQRFSNNSWMEEKHRDLSSSKAYDVATERRLHQRLFHIEGAMDDNVKNEFEWPGPRSTPEKSFQLHQGTGYYSIDLYIELLNKGFSAIAADTITEAWVRHYASGLVPAEDHASSIAIDVSGNVYVTGSSTKSPFGCDYYTVKYAPSGTFVWSSRYDSGGDNIATAIAVDASGNVYVTGKSATSGTFSDYATIKYDALGKERWIARYNGPGNSQDWATAIAVDASGNVYVTGFIEISGTNRDYATIKYDISGKERWVARYNGPGNGRDQAVAIGVDTSGNVYVTGESFRSGNCVDYATIKYNASGKEKWVARNNGMGNYDRAAAIVIDVSGNIYVTGASEGSGTAFDYSTIKYNASGTAQWIARYNGPGNYDDFPEAIAVDGSGNVYVTGRSVGSGTFFDYATIKYNDSGTEEWVTRYNGMGNGEDDANSIVVDGSGNVVVTGSSSSSSTLFDYITIKYDALGKEQWIASYNGLGNGNDFAIAVAVDGSGNICVTGRSFGSGTSQDYVTIKYNASGEYQWAARYNGPGNADDHAKAICVDVSGNVYVTGESVGSSAFTDYAIIKYNASGTEQWVARYNGPGNAKDNAKAISVDALGNVYVTGESVGSGTNFDYATIKYSVSGIEEWVARYNGLGNSYDFAAAIAVDGSGNVYVTGASYVGNNYDYITIKYDASGIQQWVSRYNGPGNADDHANAIALDSSGNVYVTGYSSNLGISSSSDYTTIMYNASGTEQWIARYNATGNNQDYAIAIAIDDSGNVYVTGSSYSSGTSVDYVTIKYNALGTEQWNARYNGLGNKSDRATAMVVDGSGNVYVTGESDGPGTGYDYATIKYNSSGIQQWVARYNGPGNSDDHATAIAIDGSKNVYITGRSMSPSTADDYVTIKYNASGTEGWVMRYNGPANFHDFASAIAVDRLGNIYVTGESSGVGWSVCTTIKYEQRPTSMERMK